VIFHDHESTQKAGRSGIIVVSVITIFSTMPGKKGCVLAAYGRISAPRTVAMCNSRLLTTPNQTLLWGIFGQASTQAVPVCKTPVRTASNQECLRRVAHNKIVLGPWFARHACITNPIVVRDRRKIVVWLMRCFRRDACLAHGREHKARRCRAD
jgi:hypothetical protein